MFVFAGQPKKSGRNNEVAVRWGSTVIIIIFSLLRLQIRCGANQKESKK